MDKEAAIIAMILTSDERHLACYTHALLLFSQTSDIMAIHRKHIGVVVVAGCIVILLLVIHHSLLSKSIPCGGGICMYMLLVHMTLQMATTENRIETVLS